LFSSTPRPPTSTLFPYTTLFRSDPAVAARGPPPDRRAREPAAPRAAEALSRHRVLLPAGRHHHADPELRIAGGHRRAADRQQPPDRKSTRLNSSHSQISYAVFCL